MTDIFKIICYTDLRAETLPLFYARWNAFKGRATRFLDGPFFDGKLAGGGLFLLGVQRSRGNERTASLNRLDEGASASIGIAR